MSKIPVSVVLTGTDAQIVRPYKGLHVNEGYSSRIDTTDALPLDTPVRPYSGLHVSEVYVVFSTPKCDLEWSSPCSGRPLLS